MKFQAAIFSATLALSSATLSAQQESPLRFYASFDKGYEPDIALDGAKVARAPSPAPEKTEGKYGGALAFRRSRAWATSGIPWVPRCRKAAGRYAAG